MSEDHYLVVVLACLQAYSFANLLTLDTLTNVFFCYFLGESLYPLVNSLNADNSGKITGMLLEMDVTEIQHMIADPVLLKNKVDEALAVLQAHKARAADAVTKPE